VNEVARGNQGGEYALENLRQRFLPAGVEGGEKCYKRGIAPFSGKRAVAPSIPGGRFSRSPVAASGGGKTHLMPDFSRLRPRHTP
jgi:hypothetical protein